MVDFFRQHIPGKVTTQKHRVCSGTTSTFNAIFYTSFIFLFLILFFLYIYLFIYSHPPPPFFMFGVELGDRTGWKKGGALKLLLSVT